jgi:NCS1 family nucleobase:cation symporter-1
MLATLTTNIAANVVAPANAFVNLAPSRISFRAGALLTAVLGIVICPWRLIASSAGAALCGPAAHRVMLGPAWPAGGWWWWQHQHW